MGAQAASICCHVERLPRQQLTVTAAPVAGPHPGVQEPEVYGKMYEETFEGAELDGVTWNHSSGVRTMDVRGINNGLLYTCIHVRKSEAPRQDEFLIGEHLRALCCVSHPHLCKAVEVFDLLEDRLLIYEKAPHERLFEDRIGKPWTQQDGEGSSSSTSKDAGQARRDERTISEMIRQILSGLAHGHARGFVHGCLTPDKVRILEGAQKTATSKGPPQVKVIGFGLGNVLLPNLGANLHKEVRVGLMDYRALAVLPGLPYTAPESLRTMESYTDHMGEVRPLSSSPRSQDEVTSNKSDSPGPSPRRGAGNPESKIDGDIKLQTDLQLVDGDLVGKTFAGSDKADIWSVGALAFRLLTGVPPFHEEVQAKREKGETKQDMLKMITQEPVLFTKKQWKSRSSKAFDAVRTMLRLNAGLRPTASELLRHPWLKIEKEPVPLARVERLMTNAVNYLRESQFKKLIIRIVAQQMPEYGVHVGHANALFRALDKDRDGLLSPVEFLKGLLQVPSVLKRLGEDPGRLFEAADRDGSGYLDAKEFVAMTMPPSKARNEKVIYYVFRAFDEEGDQIVTVDKVQYIARMMEGALLSSEQIDELSTVLNTELSKLKVPARVVEALPEPDGSDSEEDEMLAEGEIAGGEAEDVTSTATGSKVGSKEMTGSKVGSKEMTGSKDQSMSKSNIKSSQFGRSSRSPRRNSQRNTGSKDFGEDDEEQDGSDVGSKDKFSSSKDKFSSSKDKLSSSKEKKTKKRAKVDERPWIQRKLQGLIEKTRKFFNKPRPLDWHEFAYIADTRKLGRARVCFKVARKEAFKLALSLDLDFYEVIQKTSELTWPPEAGSAARTAPSVYFLHGGLTSSKQQQLKSDAKAKDEDKQADAIDEDDGGQPDEAEQEYEEDGDDDDN